MADITLGRISELLRSVFELLWTRAEGMPVKELFTSLPDNIQLTSYEKEYTSSTNTPRYERIIRTRCGPALQSRLAF